MLTECMLWIQSMPNGNLGGCCKTIMMGYVGINPKLGLCAWIMNTCWTMTLTLNYVCALGCWEEPSLSAGVLKRTLSHIWLRLYLPMFWFNVGLFTLIKIDSLMVLAFPWSSLPMMLKLASVVLCPVFCMCAWMGEGCFRCSLHLSPRVLAVSPMYSSLQAMWLHWKL